MKSFFENGKLAFGEHGDFGLQRFAVQLAPLADSGMIHPGGAMLIQTGNALAHFGPFSYAFGATWDSIRLHQNSGVVSDLSANRKFQYF